jgi:hypothetical protein
MMRIRRHGCGVLLGGTDGLEQFNNARRPPGVAGSGMSAGRGMMVRQGTARLFQAAAYWQQGDDPDAPTEGCRESAAAGGDCSG